MGMFDELICEYPLPQELKKYQHEIFQTKDLINCLDLFRITKEGELWLEKTSDGEDVISINERNSNFFRRFRKEMMYKTPIKLDFTGSIYFYHWDTEQDYFFDIFATFVDGKIQKLEKDLFSRTKERGSP